MTEKVEEKIKEVQQFVDKIKTDVDSRVDQLNSMIKSLQVDIEEVKNSQQDASVKTGTINNEIQILQNNIESEKKSIQDLKGKITTLDPELAEKKSTLEELVTKVSELTEKKNELDANITSSQEEKTKLIAEQEEKAQALASLEASIDKDLESYKSELETVKGELANIVDSNHVWDYLFEKIETPEVEIMAIIAANRNISLDDIKGKAQTVSPVFVGRAISKLEADGKIVNNNNVWDLSPSVLEVIK